MRIHKAYGIIALCAATGITLSAQTFTTLYTFSNPFGDGVDPSALIQGSDGNLYGTTFYGGNPVRAAGPGTVFKITPSGALTTIYSFCSLDCTDGQNPDASLVQGADGDFYGTTQIGGNIGSAEGDGTIFKITPSGALTTLFSFCTQSGCPTGYLPDAPLVQAASGEFYGTTPSGGPHFVGTIFKIIPSGALTTIYNFCSQSGCADGASPGAALVEAADGNFYGTTQSGGSSYGGGTIFKITPDGVFTTLYRFCPRDGCADGAYPSGLIQGTDGDFYGTTNYGGPHNYGTVFKITPDGMLRTIYSFCAQPGCPNGGYPQGSLVQATDGNFMGPPV